MRPARFPMRRTAAGWALRLTELLARLLLIGLVAAIAIRLPLPVLEDWLPLKNVVVAITAVLLAGKTLFDTLFYDRFWP